ncbi:hypothetical protein MtrunA17_Chr6g0477711 [Medicago truncatula]|uniref:Uncharacterized protein n=1 Tax=Medicago truncatula TaxID=3880 RepID=A0A396HG26_MEDTR|nr:hypothetical protein MtrunA17_Chr6g0477711 [Medicago truncatula]
MVMLDKFYASVYSFMLKYCSYLKYLCSRNPKTTFESRMVFELNVILCFCIPTCITWEDH